MRSESLYASKIALSTGRGEEPDWLKLEMQTSNPAAVISSAALAGNNPLCQKALDLFVSIYGAEAGNLGLRFMARGGVFLGGGIAPKIAPKLVSALFMESFTAKGRMSSLLQAVPVCLSDFQWEVVLGGLMGDGSLSSTKSGHGARFRFG